MPIAKKGATYTIHYGDKKNWYAVEEKELIEMLTNGDLKDGTELHREERTTVTYVIRNHGQDMMTWKGRVILTGK